MNILKKKAFLLGATDFGLSNVKNKRFYIIYNNKKIHFGSSVGRTFIDHYDEQKREAWRARHSKIKNKEGLYVYKIKTSPSFWAFNLLW
jgi:hypothetical protein